ncbi:hypothetical protein D3C72_2071620 [compost metagenome]
MARQQAQGKARMGGKVQPPRLVGRQPARVVRIDFGSLGAAHGNEVAGPFILAVERQQGVVEVKQGEAGGSGHAG